MLRVEVMVADMDDDMISSTAIFIANSTGANSFSPWMHCWMLLASRRCA